jgi:hypothetical protein
MGVGHVLGVTHWPAPFTIAPRVWSVACHLADQVASNQPWKRLDSGNQAVEVEISGRNRPTHRPPCPQMAGEGAGVKTLNADDTVPLEPFL